MVATFFFFIKRQIPRYTRGQGAFHFLFIVLKGTACTNVRFDIIKNEILYRILGTL